MAYTRKSELGWYLERIKDADLLTAEEERQLARRIREHSDVIARERMIQANLRLVIKIASEYHNVGMTLSDLVAEGNLGLMRAVEEFDPDQGVRFSTYAAWWIKQAIKRALINAGRPVHIPAYLAKLINKWHRASAELEANLGRPATREEVSRKLKISSRKAKIIQDGLRALNAPSQTGAKESPALPEMLADDGSRPEQGLMDASNGPICCAMLAQLEPRKRRIVELRFGLDGHTGPKRTYKEIGKIVGLTRERIRQLEREALQELRQLAGETM